MSVPAKPSTNGDSTISKKLLDEKNRLENQNQVKPFNKD